MEKLWNCIFEFLWESVLDNPGVTHSVPTAFMMNAVGTEWVTPGLLRMVGILFGITKF